MSRSGSFGLNPKKTYGTTQSINEVVPGTKYSDNLGEWICITANGAIAQYDFVLFDPTSSTGQAASATTTTAGSTMQLGGFAQAALATGEVGFIWVGGQLGGGKGKGIKGTVTGAYTALALLYTTATAGQISSTSTTQIKGVIGLTTTAGAGTTELFSVGGISVN